MKDDSLLGEVFDEYRLQALLGQGGMARVYRAVDVNIGRYVAIKVIDAHLRDDQEYARRFQLEAQSLAQLDHPHVVSLYRYGRVGDLLYMAMQYIDGSDLKTVLDDYDRARQSIAPDEALRVLRQVASALDYIHGRGIIHRDVKPSNLMLDRDGSVLLTDFGLALMTELGTRGEIFGTPQYIAPEQAISSARVVPQSDLYSLGVIAYELFTGMLPFDGGEPMDVALMHINDPLPDPRIYRPLMGDALVRVLEKALAKEPEHRYPTGAALVDALERAVHGDDAVAEQTTLMRRSLPELVELERERNPLPPPPAPVMAAPPAATTAARQAKPTLKRAPAPLAPDTPPPTPAHPLRTYAPYALLGVLLALIALGALFTLLGRDDQPESPVAAIIETATDTPIPPSATPVPSTATAIPPSVTFLPSTATTIPPSATPAPVIAAAQELALEIRTRRDDYLVLRVVSGTLQLAELSLIDARRDDRTIAGSQWPFAPSLAAGQCVIAVKNERTEPDTTDCTAVVSSLTIDEGRDRIWKDSFIVQFRDAVIGTCEGGNRSPCMIPSNP